MSSEIAPTPPAKESPPARWELYRLLAEPLRLRLLALAHEEELAISELSELLGEVQPNVSRHASSLRHAGLLTMRRQGTWTLVRLAAEALADPVVADALKSGAELCRRDGSLGRVSAVLAARDSSTKEFFARAGKHGGQLGLPPEIGAYLQAMRPLVPRHGLAVDAGTGDGRLLEVLSPLYEDVIAVDRSAAQLAVCAERVQQRGLLNVDLFEGDLDSPRLRQRVKDLSTHHDGADAVFAARILHHAPRPVEMLRQLRALTRPGGAVVVIDYDRHEDEALRSQQADLWLGFEAAELRRYAKEAGLRDATTTPLAGSLCGNGFDRHVGWRALVGFVPDGAARDTAEDTKRDDTNGDDAKRAAKKPATRSTTKARAKKRADGARR